MPGNGTDVTDDRPWRNGPRTVSLHYCQIIDRFAGRRVAA
jgi:hypothetical protein